jgi:hypothetical protein
MLALVPFSPLGTKRRLSLARNSRALVLVTAPTSDQLDLPSVEYCQVPLPLVRPVTAMPSDAPLSTSLTLAPSRVETCAPALPVASSVIVGKVGAAGVRTGASFTGSMVMSTVMVSDVPGSVSLARTSKLSEPLTLASGV